MNTSYDASNISFLLDPPVKWARNHPSFFFGSGSPTPQTLLTQLAEGAQRLSPSPIDVSQLDDWHIVASTEDWFPNARFPISEDFSFKSVPAFPELGQNCTRPEFVVTAFAQNVIVRGPLGIHVVKGPNSTNCRMCEHLAASESWQRAIAFRGIES